MQTVYWFVNNSILILLPGSATGTSQKPTTTASTIITTTKTETRKTAKSSTVTTIFSAVCKNFHNCWPFRKSSPQANNSVHLLCWLKLEWIRAESSCSARHFLLHILVFFLKHITVSQQNNFVVFTSIRLSSPGSKHQHNRHKHHPVPSDPAASPAWKKSSRGFFRHEGLKVQSILTRLSRPKLRSPAWIYDGGIGIIIKTHIYYKLKTSQLVSSPCFL